VYGMACTSNRDLAACAVGFSTEYFSTCFLRVDRLLECFSPDQIQIENLQGRSSCVCLCLLCISIAGKKLRDWLIVSRATVF